MAHITLSIPDELYDEMKKHREIKWSEIARRSIREEVDKRKGVIKGSELFARLPEETKKGIREISKLSESDWRRFHKKMKAKEWKRAKSLMQAR